MTLARRLEKLEQSAGPQGDGVTCACAGVNRLDVRYDDDGEADTRPAEICDVCGLEKTVLRVVYV